LHAYEVLDNLHWGHNPSDERRGGVKPKENMGAAKLTEKKRGDCESKKVHARGGGGELRFFDPGGGPLGKRRIFLKAPERTRTSKRKKGVQNATGKGGEGGGLGGVED